MFDSKTSGCLTVYRSENGGAPVAVATGLAADSFTDSSIIAGRAYSYYVSADLPGTTGPASPAAAASPFAVGGFAFDAGGAEIQFPTVRGKIYRVERSENLSAWTNVADNVAGDGTMKLIPDAFTPMPTRLFYRIVAQ